MQTIASLPLQPGPSTVNQAHAWLETLASARQWPVRTTFGLTLSLDEALSNVLMYGYPDSDPAIQPAEIVLTLRCNQDLIELEIADNGLPFDPTQRESPDLQVSLDDAVPGGHGLRLMRSYLDDLQYHYADGRNHLRLVARLPPPLD